MTHLEFRTRGELFSVSDLLEIYVFLYLFTEDSAFYKYFVVTVQLKGFFFPVFFKLS